MLKVLTRLEGLEERIEKIEKTQERQEKMMSETKEQANEILNEVVHKLKQVER